MTVNLAKNICFGDDTAILVKGESWEIAYQRVESILTRLKAWFDYGMLTLNTEKYVYSLFFKRIIPSTHKITTHIYINDNSVTTVQLYTT